MKRRMRVVISLLAFVAVAHPPSPVAATYGVDEWRMRVWMLPPMDTDYDYACLTQRWHYGYDDPAHALDWQSACGENRSKIVRFRALAAAIDDSPGPASVWAMGEPVQLANLPCGADTVRYARVKIRSTWDGKVKGKATYGHVVIRSSAPTSFDIWFNEGVGRNNAAFNSMDVADTVDDSPAGWNCWQGWHVHENNSTDSTWDSWNSLYNSGATCDCYKNTDHANWIRRMTWVDVL